MTWNPELYARAAAFVPGHGQALAALLDVEPPARVLDVGCGDGVLTAALAERGYAVTGVDASPEMVTAARARGIDAHVLDVSRGLAALPRDSRGEPPQAFTRPFDAVFSNATLHWVRDVRALLAAVRSALVAGGKFVAELGGQGNIASLLAALGEALARRGVDAQAVSPWVFPSIGAYASALEAAGFRVDFMTRFARPTQLPGHLRDWLELFAGAFLAAVPAHARADLIEEVCDALAATRRDARGVWTLDYVRLRFTASAV